MFVVGNFVVLKMNDYAGLYEEVKMFLIYLRSYNCVLQN